MRRFWLICFRIWIPGFLLAAIVAAIAGLFAPRGAIVGLIYIGLVAILLLLGGALGIFPQNKEVNAVKE